MVWTLRVLFALVVGVEVYAALAGERLVLEVSALIALGLIAIHHAVRAGER
ncbi:hypothetical protein ACFZDF_34000 [Streptomyces sp. NPDC007910]|uniref:hypothetical protein n=1 Tax=Streptomyces sp. NPDC007910 TaxID=3364790 RepID=UPI0036EA54C0